MDKIGQMNRIERYARKLFKGTAVEVARVSSRCVHLDRGDDELFSIINTGYGSDDGLFETWTFFGEPKGWLCEDSVQGTLRAIRKQNKIRPVKKGK